MTTFVYCRGCGKQIHESAPTCPSCGAPQAAVGAAPGSTFGAPPVPSTAPFVSGNGMDLQTSVRTCFRKSVVWQGRAIRSEYWYFVLFGALFSIPLAILAVAFPKAALFFSILSNLISLAILLPSLSVLVRRLHDTNRSGGWVWLGLVPIVGAIFLIVWLCQAGTPGDNRYGPNPMR